jgi:hypothetical protein
MLTYLKKLSSWIVLAIAISFVFGFIFIATHQTIRSEANATLVDTAQNIAGYLENDDTIDSQIEQLSGQIEQSTKVNLANSDKVFVSIYDGEGKPNASTGNVKGTARELDKGVIDTAKKNGVNKISWAPESDVRVAIVVYPIKKGDKGYLVVGKSLKETESNITRIGKILLVGWIITLLITLLSTIVLNNLIETLEDRKNKKGSKNSGVKETESAKTVTTKGDDTPMAAKMSGADSTSMKMDIDSADEKKPAKMEHTKAEKITEHSKKSKKSDK